jgi:very-short-patch-repair endonuclease
MTDAERTLWRVLRGYKDKGFHFRRQVPMGPYVADFACHPAKLVIEVDGGQHGLAGHQAADDRRTEWLEGQGYRVLRFWNNDVLGNADGVAALIDAALDADEER